MHVSKTLGRNESGALTITKIMTLKVENFPETRRKTAHDLPAADLLSSSSEIYVY